MVDTIPSSPLLHPTAPAVGLELVQPAEADEDVDEPLDLGPCSEETTDEVPVLSHESTETDEAPVEGADENEDTGDLSERRAITAGHRGLGEERVNILLVQTLVGIARCVFM